MLDNRLVYDCRTLRHDLADIPEYASNVLSECENQAMTDAPVANSQPNVSAGLLPFSQSGLQSGPLRCLSIDVEEYFHIEAAYKTIPRSDWDKWPSRVEASVDLLLSLFNRHNRVGTFFILGYVARKFPQMVKRIAEQGHEIASHGSGHDRLHRLTPETFAADLRESKQILQDLSGQQVVGYRAPTFSVMPETSWAIDVLLDEGFTYDGSVFPVRHHWYGVPNAPDKPFMIQGQSSGRTLLEIPPLTYATGNKKWPVAGGGYFRLLPLWFMKAGLKQAAAQNRPAVLYFHPWEFDPEIPAMGLPLTGRLRTYTGLKTAAKKLESVIKQPAQWTTMAKAAEIWREDAMKRPTFTLSMGK